MAAMKQHTTPWVGKWLNGIRLKKNIEAKAIADKLGIHPANVARRECGDQRIVVDDMPGILDAYGIAPDVFARKLKDRQP